MLSVLRKASITAWEFKRKEKKASMERNKNPIGKKKRGATRQPLSTTEEVLQQQKLNSPHQNGYLETIEGDEHIIM